jgi:cytolysin-activating lysine-acyltransferase
MSKLGQRPYARAFNGTKGPLADKLDVAMEDRTASEAAASAAPTETPQTADSKPTPLTEKIHHQAATLRNALAFTQVVGVLMRSPHYSQYKLADLEWLAIPPLLAGQFRIGEVKPDKNQGAALPVAVVLWASVSAEVDQKLMEADGASFRLKPEDWQSGDNIWLMHAAGETRFVKHVVDQLMKTTMKGRRVKVLGGDKDGKSKVHVLGESVAA